MSSTPEGSKTYTPTPLLFSFSDRKSINELGETIHINANPMTALITSLAKNCGTNLKTIIAVRMVSATVTGEYFRLEGAVECCRDCETVMRSLCFRRKEVSGLAMGLCLAIQFL